MVGLLAVFVLVIAIGQTGCVEDQIVGNAQSASNAPAVATTKVQVETPEEVSQDKGLLEKAGDFLEKAKSDTGATAQGAQDWVTQKIGDAANAGGESATDAMSWANDTFESLKENGLTNAENTSQWLKQDWKNMQSWEYKTIELEETADAPLDKQLNTLGAAGWECFHIDSGKFYFKKPADSYLRHLPFNDFIKLIPLLQQAR